MVFSNVFQYFVWVSWNVPLPTWLGNLLLLPVVSHKEAWSNSHRNYILKEQSYKICNDITKNITLFFVIFKGMRRNIVVFSGLNYNNNKSKKSLKTRPIIEEMQGLWARYRGSNQNLVPIKPQCHTYFSRRRFKS